MHGLLVTLGLGLFIILGAAIVFFTKNNKKFVQFSLSFAFAVMIILVLTDLIPEAYEVLSSISNLTQTIITILVGIAIGFIILFVLDYFVPDHEDDPHTKKDDKDNLKHIGLISSIALVIHNVIEGMAIYLITTTSLTAGLMTSLGVGLHNIPLGMVIASTFYQSNKDKKKTMWIILGISLSTFVGGLLVYLLNPAMIPPILEGVALSITVGMLAFIIIMELLPKVIQAKDKKTTLLGIVAGLALLIIAFMI